MFRTRARNRYVPVPASGVNVAPVAVWPVSQVVHVVDPGRITCTSDTNPVGIGADAHATANGVVVFPVVGETSAGTCTEPEKWLTVFTHDPTTPWAYVEKEDLGKMVARPV